MIDQAWLTYVTGATHLAILSTNALRLVRQKKNQTSTHNIAGFCTHKQVLRHSDR